MDMRSRFESEESAKVRRRMNGGMRRLKTTVPGYGKADSSQGRQKSQRRQPPNALPMQDDEVG